MRTTLSSTLAENERAERRASIRQLLREPLTLAKGAPEAFSAIWRHGDWLKSWFSDRTGWVLFIDRDAGFARLHKVPARQRRCRPARIPGKGDFTVRRYTLLCLTLAALDDSAGQTTLVRLAELVEQLSIDDEAVSRFAPESYSERHAFVDALRWLVGAGVLSERDGDVNRYARTRSGDALYDVNDRILAHLISAPLPPSFAGSETAMAAETYPESEEGNRQAAKHQLFRALLDDPVVYNDDLNQHEREWLGFGRGFLYRSLAKDAGLPVERRAEGFAAVDPLGEVTDVVFPDGRSTAKHAALLIASLLSDRARPDPSRVFPLDEVVTMTRGLLADFGRRCGWSKEYTDGDGGAATLATDVLGLLAGFGLVREAPGGWIAMPAIARFCPGAPTQKE